MVSNPCRYAGTGAEEVGGLVLVDVSNPCRYAGTSSKPPRRQTDPRFRTLVGMLEHAFPDRVVAVRVSFRTLVGMLEQPDPIYRRL